MARARCLACIRCGAEYPLQHYAQDCDRCRPSAPSNLTVRYAGTLSGPRLDAVGTHLDSLWRYAPALPVEAEQAVTLGEGMTPLVRIDRLAGQLGLGSLHVKDESRNPTWSFKDRMATVVISAAVQLGAKVIATSSSGNAGAAVAAYAARAGLPCVVFTFAGTAGPMVTQMRSYGAMVVTVRTKSDRWRLLEEAVRRLGWFPTSPFFAPAVGSNPFGVEGYKTLAFEIAEQLDWQVPEWCVLPVCYGDALYGMWKGFDELYAAGWIRARPRMVAAEVFGSLGVALKGGGDVVPEVEKTRDTIAVSIGATRSTYQALRGMRESGGTSCTVSDEALLDWQIRLGREGIYAEPSSVAPLAAIERLRADGVIAEGATAVAVATASGLKDPAATERRLDKTPEIGAETLDGVLDILGKGYGFTV